MRRTLIGATIGWLTLACSVALPQEPQRLPGELTVELGRELIGSKTLPTLLEIERAVREPSVKALVIFRLCGDKHNHYGPVWSFDGRAMACLRADIDVRTCKVIVFPELFQPQPQVIYEDSLSYEHMPSWSTNSRRQLSFASNRGDDRLENIHLWEMNETPRILTTGSGSKVLPQLSTQKGRLQVLFRRIDHFELIRFSAQKGESPETRELGAADEMRLSPSGDVMAIVRPSVQERGQELSVRNLSTQHEVRLLPPANRLLRNPSWSPDGRWLAIWSRAIDGRDWELWTASGTGEVAPMRLVVGVRVQEDFRHVGPAWSPDSNRIWFTLSRGEQSYYPLQWVAPDGSARGQVDYDRSVTTAFDVAACPHPAVAALAFVAVTQRPLDVYVMLLNHP